MLSLTQLLQKADGSDWLQSRGVHYYRNDFVSRLQRPACTSLAASIDAAGQKLVYSHQQVYLDYRRSVLSKIDLLAALKSDPELFPFFLWIDTDRSESDKLSTRIYWTLRGKQHAIKLAPSRTKDIESRYVQLDSALLAQGVDRLEAYLMQMNRYKEQIEPRYRALRRLFVDSPPPVLSSFNLQVTDFLLERHQGYRPFPLMLSNLAGHGFLNKAIEHFINRLPGVIEVFNDTIQQLQQMGIDVPVRRLRPDYFPLHYTCPVDLKRIRLRHKTEAGSHFATATCRCGHHESFYLGRRTLSIDTIAATNRWSPDVCVPIFMNELVSGFVAGRSSALYSLVMNEVLRRVLGQRPVPILIPDNRSPDSAAPEVDSLLHDYLIAKETL